MTSGCADGQAAIGDGTGQIGKRKGGLQNIPGRYGELKRFGVKAVAPLDQAETGKPHVFHCSAGHPDIAGGLWFHQHDTGMSMIIVHLVCSVLRAGHATA